MEEIKRKLLKEIVNLEAIPQGAFSFRQNGESAINSTENIIIEKNQDNSGINIHVKPNTKNCSLHMPVILTKSGLKDVVNNNFYIGENSEIVIIAGCGIHNAQDLETQHTGCHTFYLDNNSKVKYIEKHVGLGQSGKIFNPTTKINMQDNCKFEMETTQIGGVDKSKKQTTACVKGKNCVLKLTEKILTGGEEKSKSNYKIFLCGENSKAQIISRNVARNKSKQEFESKIEGHNKCYARVECDGIVLDEAVIKSEPAVNAYHNQAQLHHEASIGKLSSEQLIKLESLGLSREEAESVIIESYLS